jgi:preprotein translocase subunit YajC
MNVIASSGFHFENLAVLLVVIAAIYEFRVVRPRRKAARAARRRHT